MCAVSQNQNRRETETESTVFSTFSFGRFRSCLCFGTEATIKSCKRSSYHFDPQTIVSMLHYGKRTMVDDGYQNNFCWKHQKMTKNETTSSRPWVSRVESVSHSHDRIESGTGLTFPLDLIFISQQSCEDCLLNRTNYYIGLGPRLCRHSPSVRVGGSPRQLWRNVSRLH